MNYPSVYFLLLFIITFCCLHFIPFNAEVVYLILSCFHLSSFTLISIAHPCDSSLSLFYSKDLSFYP